MENKKPLHVLVVTTWYPQGKDKLIGIYHKLFCKAMADHGVKINMLYIDRLSLHDAPRFPFMEKFYELPSEGYTTYCMRMLDRRRFSFDWQMDAYTRNLEKLYNRYEALHGKPDIIHAQVQVPAGYAACVLGKKIGVPVVIQEHASYFECFFRGQESKYGIFAADNAARLLCVGKYMVELYEKQGYSAQVLANIVECGAFSGPRQKNDDGLLHFTSVCALWLTKRIDGIAQALKLLRDQNLLPPFRYTVVGAGAYMEYYQNAIRELGMDDCVEFVGQKTTDEIAQILSKTDMLLLGTNLETFGIPVIEALAAGVPVVSTKCKGPEGFLTPACSELCEVDDPQSMADAILRLYRRLPELNEQELRAVAKQFDAASIAAQAVSIYEEVLSEQ